MVSRAIEQAQDRGHGRVTAVDVRPQAVAFGAGLADERLRLQKRQRPIPVLGRPEVINGW